VLKDFQCEVYIKIHRFVKKIRKDITEKQKLVNTKIAACYVHNVITKFEFIEFVSCKFLPH
jgi:Fe-S oxidoreductase